MKPIATTTALLLAGMIVAGSAWARITNVTDPDLPHSLPDEGPVAVQWSDPAKFTEIRHSHNRWVASRGDWVRDLAEYLRKRAPEHLPLGSRLEVTITDIDRAGSFEPWRGIQADSIRFMRDIYPPRIDLTFTLTGTDGNVLAQGTRELADLGYLMGSTRLGDTDPLRYDKQLIDDWLRKEFKAGA